MIADLGQVLIMMILVAGMSLIAGLIVTLGMITVTAVTNDKAYFRKKIDRLLED